jgi:hypothetical protein
VKETINTLANGAKNLFNPDSEVNRRAPTKNYRGGLAQSSVY